jgi:hypothetical protein
MAARNVLLRSSLEAVISDFGMSRELVKVSVGKTRNDEGPVSCFLFVGLCFIHVCFS